MEEGISPRRDLKQFLASQSRKKLLKIGYWLLVPAGLFWLLALMRWWLSYEVLLDLFFSNRTIGYISVVVLPITSSLLFFYTNHRYPSRPAKWGVAGAILLLILFALSSSRNS